MRQRADAIAAGHLPPRDARAPWDRLCPRHTRKEHGHRRFRAIRRHTVIHVRSAVREQMPTAAHRHSEHRQHAAVLRIRQDVLTIS